MKPASSELVASGGKKGELARDSAGAERGVSLVEAFHELEVADLISPHSVAWASLVGAPRAWALVLALEAGLLAWAIAGPPLAIEVLFFLATFFVPVVSFRAVAGQVPGGDSDGGALAGLVDVPWADALYAWSVPALVAAVGLAVLPTGLSLGLHGVTAFSVAAVLWGVWVGAHALAGVGLLGRRGPEAARRAPGEALKALVPTYQPGRRTWRRSMYTAVATLAMYLAAVGLLSPVLFVMHWVLGITSDAMILLPAWMAAHYAAAAWGAGVLSGVAAEAAALPKEPAHEGEGAA